jgi:hypothetical protein
MPPTLTRCLLGAALVVGATACPSTSVSDAGASIEPFTLDDRVPAVEIPVTVTSDAASELVDRTVSVSLDAPAQAGVLVEVLDGSGDRLAARAAGPGEPATATATQDCTRDRCDDGLIVRVRSLAEAGGSVDGATVRVEATAERTASLDDLTVAAGAADPLDADALDRRAPMREPTPLGITNPRRAAGTLVEIPDPGCDAPAPWIVVLPGAEPTADPPATAQARIVTGGTDTPLGPGAGRAVVDACDDDTVRFWVVLAAPVRSGTLVLDWALLPAPGTGEPTTTEATTTTTDTDPVELGATPATLAPVALASGDAALHLVEGVDETNEDITGGGPDGIVVEPVGEAPPAARPATGSDTWTEPWIGTGYAPVLAGPCPPAACPTSATLDLRFERVPASGETTARAVVFSLVTG